MISRRSAFWAGVQAFIPIMFGVVPFALISGVAAVSAGFSVPLALAMSLAMSLVVYAGSAQLVAVQLISANAPLVLVVFTVLIVNLRFVMYSASLAPYLRQKALWRNGLLAYLMTDQSYALSISRFQVAPEMPHRFWYYLGIAVAMWVTWQVGAVIGIFMGAQVPANWQLDFTIPLTFIALAVPAIRNQRLAIVALVAGSVAVLTALLPFKLGLLISVMIAVAIGLLLERRAR